MPDPDSLDTFSSCLDLDPHSVERAVNEEHRNREEHNRENARRCSRPARRSEIASSTASNPNSVVNLMIGFSATELVSLKGSPTVSPTTVAACRSRSLCLQFRLDNLLRVIPGAAGIRHEDRLVQAEERDRDQIADEEVGIDEGKAKRCRRTPSGRY